MLRAQCLNQVCCLELAALRFTKDNPFHFLPPKLVNDCKTGEVQLRQALNSRRTTLRQWYKMRSFCGLAGFGLLESRIQSLRLHPILMESEPLRVMTLGNLGFNKPSRQLYAQQSLRSTAMGQRSANFFFKMPHKKYLKL